MYTSNKKSQTIDERREKHRLYCVQYRQKLREKDRQSLEYIFADIARVAEQRRIAGQMLCV